MMARHFASLLLALCVSLFLTNPTFAQTAAPAVSAPATPAAPELDKQGRPKAKEVRADCKADAEAKGLKGDDKREAVMACVVKQRPDLAAKMAAREQCRTDGKAKGLQKDELKAFVKDCAKGKS
jgi:hypothetical protein